MTTPLERVFAALREVLRAHADGLSVARDEPGHYRLEAPVGPATLRSWDGKVRAAAIPVAWAETKSAYVGYHLMGLPGNATLLESLSDGLRARLKGKACFNFAAAEPASLRELGRVTAQSLRGLRQAGFIAAEPGSRGAARREQPAARRRERARRDAAPLDHGNITILRRLALQLPDVTESTTERGIAFKARGRLLACQAIHKSAEPGSFVVCVSPAERPRLLAEHPAALYLPQHYAKHPAVLARLSLLDRAALRDILASAWSFVTEQAPERQRRSLRRPKR